MPEAICVASQKEGKICIIYLKLYVESAKEPQREENTYKELKLKGSRENLIILEISAQNSISIFNQFFTICPALASGKPHSSFWQMVQISSGKRTEGKRNINPALAKTKGWDFLNHPLQITFFLNNIRYIMYI